MIKKIADNAYFTIDTESFLTQITAYDPIIANQTICSPDISDQIVVHEPEVDDSD